MLRSWSPRDLRNFACFSIPSEQWERREAEKEHWKRGPGCKDKPELACFGADWKRVGEHRAKDWGRKLPQYHFVMKAGKRGAKCDNGKTCLGTVFLQRAREGLLWEVKNKMSNWIFYQFEFMHDSSILLQLHGAKINNGYHFEPLRLKWFWTFSYYPEKSICLYFVTMHLSFYNSNEQQQKNTGNRRTGTMGHWCLSPY